MIIFILIASGTISLFIVGITAYGLYIGKEKIFGGSGVPAAVAKVLLSAMFYSSKYLSGILIITLISILIVNDSINSEAGLPLLSAVAGYLLANDIREVFRNIPDKKQNESKQQ